MPETWKKGIRQNVDMFFFFKSKGYGAERNKNSALQFLSCMLFQLPECNAVHSIHILYGRRHRVIFLLRGTENVFQEH